MTREPRPAVRHAQPRARLDGRPGRRRAAPGGLRRRARVRYAAARGGARRVARRLPPDRPRGARGAGRRGPGHPGAQPRRLGRRRPTPTRSATSAGPGWCSRCAGVRRWPTPTRSCGTRCARRWPRYTAAVARRARPTRSSTSGTWPSTVSLVGLTGSPRLVAMAESLMRRAPARARPGRPDPPQRPRPGRRPTPLLVMLLERGDVDGAVADPRARTSPTPRWRSSTRLGAEPDAGLSRPVLVGSRAGSSAWLADQRRRARRWRPGSSTASASTARPAGTRSTTTSGSLLFVALILGVVNVVREARS